MSLSRELQLHITQLQEIRSILNAMKNLAFMEVHKLLRFKTMQGQAVANIERVTLDFLDFYPCRESHNDSAMQVYIVLGAERGFCGDFNESLLQVVENQACTGIIAIGSRLCNRLEGISPEIIATLEGANVAEEVPHIINRLIDTLDALYGKIISNLNLTIIYHDDSAHQINQLQLLPPFPEQQQDTFQYRYPPVLNLAPGDFFADLVDHYLLAMLHQIFYISLNTENQRRLQHLEAAVNHLDDQSTQLLRKSQVYRQEEITEEIEVILLNTEINSSH
jgi:F-type H+-transporting ATPase subunit gamma